MDLKTALLAIMFVCLGAAYGIVMGRWSIQRHCYNRCGCGHDYALHVFEPERCLAVERRPFYDFQSGQVGWRYVDCRCQCYTGDDPFEEVEARA